MNQFFKKPIIQLLIIAFVVRMLFSLLPAFEIDQNDWRLWSLRMAHEGASHFYSQNIFTDYTPGFLYFLWLAGLIKASFLTNFSGNNLGYDLLLKLPANIADLLTSLIIYLIAKKIDKKWAILGFLLYIFNPAIFFNSSIWGQFDSISTLLILSATLILVNKKIPEIAAVLVALALTIKPQAVFFIPAFSILFLLKINLRRLPSSLFVFITTFVITYIPFVSSNLVEQIIKINTQVGNVFKCTTCFAFNFWGLFGNWKNDTNILAGIPFTYWGIMLTSLSLIATLLLRPFRLKYHMPFIYLTISLSIISFYTFLTRMHERYLFPFFCFFLIAALLLRSRKLIYFYLLFSIISTFNLYLPYAYYNYVYTNISQPPFVNLLIANFKLLSLIFVISFVGLIWYSVKLYRRYQNEN